MSFKTTVNIAKWLIVLCRWLNVLIFTILPFTHYDTPTILSDGIYKMTINCKWMMWTGTRARQNNNMEWESERNHGWKRNDGVVHETQMRNVIGRSVLLEPEWHNLILLFIKIKCKYLASVCLPLAFVHVQRNHFRRMFAPYSVNKDTIQNNGPEISAKVTHTKTHSRLATNYILNRQRVSDRLCTRKSMLITWYSN